METLKSRASHVSLSFGAEQAYTDNAVRPRAELLDCQVILAGSDIYGQVLGGTISLRSKLLALSKLPVL